MNLPFRKSSNVPQSPILTEMNGPLPQPSSQRPRPLLRAGLLIVAGLLVIGLLFMGGLGVYHKTTQHHIAAPTVSTAVGSGHNPTQSVGSGPNVTSNGSSNTAGTNNSPTPSSSATSGQTLTNTGPGSSLAIFIASVVLGSLGYQLILRRRIQ